MAKHSQSILDLARRGAQHRYEELKSEMESLVRQFPGLTAIGRGVVRRGRRAAHAAVAELQPRRRRRMSAAARKRISDAQKARWAKQKSAEKKK
jgi:antibiotic biosynthesis monooxygenase (ABM) superfamily enzyme